MHFPRVTGCTLTVSSDVCGKSRFLAVAGQPLRSDSTDLPPKPRQQRMVTPGQAHQGRSMRGNLIVIRALIVTGGLVFGAGLAAPIAHADTTQFNDYLARHGADTSTSAMLQSNDDVGQAICNLFATHEEAGDSARTTRLDAMDLMSGDTNNVDAATWMVGSINYLCPQYESMLP
jgi:hypothetical protein